MVSGRKIPENISGDAEIAPALANARDACLAEVGQSGSPEPASALEGPAWRMPEELRPIYEPIQQEIAQVEQFLQAELRSRFPALDELMRYGFRLGGKRMRPALVLLSAKAIGPIRPEHILVAAVVELIHTATLVHDDVLDEATLRRHLLTINARWNTESSVLLGDYLFTHALCLATRLEDLSVYRVLAETTRTLCEGELRQVQQRGQYSLSEEEYLDIIWAKTAALCECACGLGAYYAGASPTEHQALRRYGSDLGVAFQITDDLLDLIGDEQRVGKSLGTDIAKQKITLPLIHLLRQLNDPERNRLIELLGQPIQSSRPLLRRYCEQTDAALYTLQKAAEYIRRAKSHLELVPPSPARTALEQLADFVLAREH